jgi:hypothetical protein
MQMAPQFIVFFFLGWPFAQVDPMSRANAPGADRVGRVLSNDRNELARTQIADQFAGNNHHLIARATLSVVGFPNICFSANH